METKQTLTEHLESWIRTTTSNIDQHDSEFSNGLAEVIEDHIKEGLRSILLDESVDNEHKQDLMSLLLNIED